MRRRFIQIDGELVEVSQDYTPEPRESHYVIPDIQPFKSNDGTPIRSRSHWRDHLKATNSIEMGHSDLKHAQAQHEKRKAANQERLSKAAQFAKAADVSVTEVRRINPAIAVDVANRLHNRPMPERKTLIKIALEEARRRNR